MQAVILDFVAAQRRAANPLQAPRLAAALVGVACSWALLPLTVVCVGVAAYRSTLFAASRSTLFAAADGADK